MLVAAAVCPHPPLLVPGVDAGEGAEVERLRVSCDDAVRALAAERPDLLVVVGAAVEGGEYGGDAWGSLAAYGAADAVPPGSGQVSLPLSLTIGRWLLQRADVRLPRRFVAVAETAPAGTCAALGSRLAAEADRVALLVMGDGSARQIPKGPGYLDPRAEPFDRAVGAALAAADSEALLALDAALARDLLVAGRPAWQVLAGAAAGDGAWQGRVSYAEAPYGVGYLVATWLRTGN
jgi:hypothetical protein